MCLCCLTEAHRTLCIEYPINPDYDCNQMLNVCQYTIVIISEFLAANLLPVDSRVHCQKEEDSQFPLAPHTPVVSDATLILLLSLSHAN